MRDLFDTVFVVPESVEIYHAQQEGLPISHVAPKSMAGIAYARIASSIAIHAHNSPEQDESPEVFKWTK